MTNEQLETVITRALSDEAFLDRLLKAPEAAAQEIGVPLSEEEISTIRGMTPDEFRTFASDYRSVTDPAKRRAAC